MEEIEEQNLNIRDENGNLYINGEKIDALGLFYFSDKNTFKLLFNSKKAYVSDIDRFNLDILISLQEFITKDNRVSFVPFNEKIEILFNDFRRNIQDVLIERHKTTGSSEYMENNQE